MKLKATSNKISNAQLRRLYALAGNRKAEMHDVIAKYNYESVQDIERDDYEAICNEFTYEDISEVFKDENTII